MRRAYLVSEGMQDFQSPAGMTKNQGDQSFLMFFGSMAPGHLSLASFENKEGINKGHGDAKGSGTIFLRVRSNQPPSWIERALLKFQV